MCISAARRIAGRAVIGEHKERAGIGDDATMQRHAVHCRGHSVFADAVVDEGAAVVSRHRASSSALARVLFEPVRSAEPPIISGSAAVRVCSAEFDDERVAISFGVAAKVFLHRLHGRLERQLWAIRHSCGG